MDKGHAAFFTLLRSGLWEQDIDELSLFPLSSAGWAEVYRMARQQTVTGIVFRGIQYLPDSLFPQETVLVPWVASVDAIERKNRDMNRTVVALYVLFAKEGLEPVLLKGQGIACFYEYPEERECGDIDLYFPVPEDASAAVRCLAGEGADVRKMPDGSFFCRWKGVDIEVHTRMVDFHNPFQSRKLKKMESRWGWRGIILPGTDLTVTVPSPIMNLLLLDTHILKHALGWGIGLRQFCDLARVCYLMHEEIDADEVRHISKTLGLVRWNSLLFSFLTDFLRLPVKYLPYLPEQTVPAAPLLDIVSRGGNFGHYVCGRHGTGSSVWKRKWKTSSSFLKNMNFAWRYAPKETFWLFGGLVKGNLLK